MHDWAARYLGLLHLERREPSLAALTEITRAHVEKVPFESISSILRRSETPHGPVPPLDSEQILETWIARRGGGVCFEVTLMLDRLLRALGYSTFPVLARIGFPGSHQANLVELDGRHYLVDAGNGAPFSEPIPLEQTVEIRRAGLAYRFRPTAATVTWQDRFIDGNWQPFAEYTLTRADERTQETAYQLHHTIGRSWVVDNLVLVRCTDDHVWSLRDAELRQFTRDGKMVRQLADASEYRAVAADMFGVPALPIDAARAALAARLSAEAPSGRA